MNNYTHVQTSAATVWNVAHNLGTYPVSDVTVSYNGLDQKVLPLSVIYIDANNVEVHFTEPRSGSVRLFGAFTFKL